MTPADPESVSYIRLALATSVVAGLLVLLGFGLRALRNRGLLASGPTMAPKGARRLEITETLPLDMRRRLVIVAMDGEEHLLLLGHDRDIVVASRQKKNHLPQ